MALTGQILLAEGVSEKTEKREEDNAGAEDKQGRDEDRPYNSFFRWKRLFIELMSRGRKHKEDAIAVTRLQYR